MTHITRICNCDPSLLKPEPTAHNSGYMRASPDRALVTECHPADGPISRGSPNRRAWALGEGQHLLGAEHRIMRGAARVCDSNFGMSKLPQRTEAQGHKRRAALSVAKKQGCAATSRG